MAPAAGQACAHSICRAAFSPPTVGATLESVDEGSIRNIAGIVKVVREGNFLAVVAENEWAAIKGARDLTH